MDALENIKMLQNIKLSRSWKKRIYKFLTIPRILSTNFRQLPNFLIIGAPRSGTTSLFNYLMQHPEIKAPLLKEIHYFDFQYNNGLNWYKSHFPIKRGNIISGEASPFYILHPHVPRRVNETIPDVKIIALLRNPVDRAYSHYKRNVKRGIESLSLIEAFEKNNERLNGEMEKLQTDEKYYSLNLHKYSYFVMGVYVQHLKNWDKYFSKEQILILKSEDLYEQPIKTYNQVLHFLKVPSWDLNEYKQFNYQKYEEINKDTRAKIEKYFEPHNETLYKYLGKKLDW